MTETCPLCDAELDPFEPLFPDVYTCPDCSYMSGREGNLISKNHLIYQVAEILVALLEDVKNINTDDELEEIEKEVERGRAILKRLLEVEDNRITPQEEERTYPAPNPYKPSKNPPNQPWQYFTDTKSSGSDWLSTTNTSDALKSVEDWLDELDNDED